MKDSLYLLIISVSNTYTNYDCILWLFSGFKPNVDAAFTQLQKVLTSTRQIVALHFSRLLHQVENNNLLACKNAVQCKWKVFLKIRLYMFQYTAPISLKLSFWYISLSIWQHLLSWKLKQSNVRYLHVLKCCPKKKKTIKTLKNQNLESK